MSLSEIVDAVNAWVWGWPLIAILLATGLLYTFGLRFLPVRYLLHGFRHTFSKEDEAHGEVSNFASLCTALATTIGTGNIVGVATAIGVGGPGALFWMEIAAFLGMATKYAEGFLAIRYRRVAEGGRILGGPFQYIEMGLGPKWKPLAIAFSIFGLGAALLGVGTFTQVNSITDAVRHVCGAGWARPAGVVVTLAVAAVVMGGVKRIATVASVIVPFMAVFYVLVCGLLIVLHVDHLPAALLAVVKGAFDPAAVGGGALGTFFVAVQSGVSRGIFSNEAGLGSAPIASAIAQTKEPVHQGLISMTGVFLDTMVVCTMTGLAIVVTDTWKPELGYEGVNITLAAFAKGLPFGKSAAEGLLTVSLAFFAFTTTIGWTFYAERCLEYLVGFGRRLPIVVLRILFIAAVAAGPYMSVKEVWDLASIFCGLMAFPNLIALIGLSPVVMRATKDYFGKKGR